VLIALDWRLALVVLLPVPIIGLGLRRFNRHVRPIYRRVRDRLGDINTRLQDDLAGIRVVQAFGQEDAELERFRSVSERYYRERVHRLVEFLPASFSSGQPAGPAFASRADDCRRSRR
jgi:ATP-binding cassette subfamily B protein